jgi:hypothetical protein
MSSKTLTRSTADYEADFYAWTQDQAEKLRARRHNEIDWENLAEEIESVGRSDRRSIRSNLHVILLHLLKWQYQSENRKGGWAASISEHRDRMRRIIEDSPSLASVPGEAIEHEYAAARRRACMETGMPLDRFPERCPYSVSEVLDEAYPVDLHSDPSL